MLNIGVRAHDYCTSSIEESGHIIGSKGFKRIQLALAKSIRGFEPTSGRITPGFASSVRNTLSKSDISIAVLGCYINLAHPDEGKRRSLFDYFKTHLRYCREFGASMVGTETGSLNADYSFNPENHTDKALGQVTENIAELTSQAERNGALIAIEAVTKHIVNTPLRMKKVLDAIPSGNLQVILDPANLLDENNYTDQARVIGAAIDLLGDRIVAVHVKDFQIVNGAMKTVEAGKGMLDYKPVLSWVKRNKPSIDLLLENATPETVNECAAYVRSLYDAA